jgi:hypothetical protein
MLQQALGPGPTTTKERGNRMIESMIFKRNKNKEEKIKTPPALKRHNC